MKTPFMSFKSLKAKSWGTITVSEDEQLERWIKAMPAGTQSCPYWYSIRLFKGTETSPGVNKNQNIGLEYVIFFFCRFY